MSARRGEDLRVHILWTAKQVFLEHGFERASMDEVAARARTSKRTVYAKFGSKEGLFLEVIELVRELYVAQLGVPEDFAEDPVEALTRFLGRLNGHVLWESVVRTCRMAISEAERLPEAARSYYAVIVDIPQSRIADFLEARLGWDPDGARRAAEELQAVLVHPRLMRALYAVDEPLAERYVGEGAPPGVDLDQIRATVQALLAARTRRSVARGGEGDDLSAAILEDTPLGDQETEVPEHL